MKKLCIIAASLLMAFATPVLVSCSDDDDNKGAVTVDHYSAEDAKAYLKANYSALGLGNGAEALAQLDYVQDVVHHFRDVYEKYEPVDQNVNAQNVISDLFGIMRGGDINFLEFFDKYKDVKGTYTANDETKKWEQTGDAAGFVLNFKDQNGKDVKADITISDSRDTKPASEHVVVIRLVLSGGDNLDISIGGQFSVGQYSCGGSTNCVFGKVRTVKSFLVTDKSLNVSSTLMVNGKEMMNTETRFSGDNCMAAVTGGFSASSLKQAEVTNVLANRFVQRITCSDIQAMVKARKDNRGNAEQLNKALVEFRNKYMKQQTFDNRYKLLYTTEYEMRNAQTESGTASFIAPVYKFADGSTFRMIDVLGLDKNLLANTIGTFYEMIEEAIGHYKETK